MRRTHYILLLLIFFLCSSIRTKKNGEYKLNFAVKVGLIGNNSCIKFSLFGTKNGKITGTRNIGKTELLNIGVGKWPIPGSNTRRNLFEEENIIVHQAINQRTLKEEPYCPSFEHLWKIRFSEFPFKTSTPVGDGWSNGMYKPTPAQQEYILNTYGVQNFERDYFSDTSFFKLLRDVVDTNWIANYKSL